MGMMVLLLAFTVAGCGSDNNSSMASSEPTPTSTPTSTSPDTSAPVVTAMHPLRDASNAVINQKIIATFSKPMNPDTINTATFTLMAPGSIAVTGTVSYAGSTATFAPSSLLTPNTLYVATITTGAQRTTGVALNADHVWRFTTGTLSDTSAPRIVGTNPLSDGTDVPRNRKIAITFSENMEASTISSTILVTGPDTLAVAGTVDYADKTATFTPATPFAASTTFTVSISEGAKDLADNALVPRSFSFTTGTSMDTVAPSLTTTTPANAATNVCLDQILSATFSEPMDISSTPIRGSLTGPGGTSVDGQVSYDTASNTVTFIPGSNLIANTLYTATIDKDMKDLAGNLLATGSVVNPITFTTGMDICAAPTP